MALLHTNTHTRIRRIYMHIIIAARETTQSSSRNEQIRYV